MAAPRKKSPAYVEAVLREAVLRVERCLHKPLQAVGYDGPREALDLSGAQHDFMAGYVYGALQRLLELAELEAERELEEATRRLYGRVLGRDDDGDLWHTWIVREGLYYMQRPHVFLGYCAGRNDIVSQLRVKGFAPALNNALVNLEGL